MTLSTWIMRVGAKLIGLPVAVAVVLFAVSNRHLVDIALWPFSGGLAMPVYLVTLLALLLGLVLGAVAMWLSAGRLRRRARRAERTAKSLGRDLALAESGQDAPAR